jgi:hypothetical protein
MGEEIIESPDGQYVTVQVDPTLIDQRPQPDDVSLVGGMSNRSSEYRVRRLDPVE